MFFRLFSNICTMINHDVPSNKREAINDFFATKWKDIHNVLSIPVHVSSFSIMMVHTGCLRSKRKSVLKFTYICIGKVAGLFAVTYGAHVMCVTDLYRAFWQLNLLELSLNIHWFFHLNMFLSLKKVIFLNGPALLPQPPS